MRHIPFFRIRAGYDFGQTYGPDLAMLTLDRKVTFSDYVGPVCVPDSVEFPDHPTDGSGEHMMAFVAGWGASYSTCDSNDYGPMPHTQCKFPFIFKGKTYDRYSSNIQLWHLSLYLISFLAALPHLHHRLKISCANNFSVMQR